MEPIVEYISVGTIYWFGLYVILLIIVEIFALYGVCRFCRNIWLRFKMRFEYKEIIPTIPGCVMVILIFDGLISGFNWFRIITFFFFAYGIVFLYKDIRNFFKSRKKAPN